MTTEHVLCKFCDPPRRHPLGEPHIYGTAESPLEVAKKKIAKVEQTGVPSNDARPLPKKGVKGAEAAFVREAAKATLARSEWDVGQWADCPRCAERAAKKAAQMARYRERKK